MTFFGLSEREAEASRKKYGLNELLYKPSVVGNILRGLNGLSCKLFAVAALAEIIRVLLGLIGVISSEPNFIRPAAFLAAGLLCGFAEAWLRYRSERTLNKLCGHDGDAVYTVFRNNGKTERVPRKMLAVGDAVFVSAGDVIPADGTMADGSLTVDQSVFGVIGKAEKTAPPEGYRKGGILGISNPYMVYSGTSVCGGSGTVKITAIGENTGLAKKKKVKAVEINGEKFSGILRTGAAAGSAAAVAVLVFFAVSGALSGQLLGGLARGVSSAAAALAIVCLGGKNLVCETAAAAAVKRLDKKGVRISKPDRLNDSGEIGLAVIERAGIIAEAEYSAGGTAFIDGSGREYGSAQELGAGLSEMLRNAVVCTSSAVMADGKALGGSPLDRALYRFIEKKEGKPANLKKQTEVKADGASVLSGVTVSAGGRLFTFVRGGADILLERCTDSIGADGKKQKITNESALRKLAAAVSLSGKDVVAFAVSDRGIKDGRLPSAGYSLIGLAVLFDSFFDSTADEVKRLEKLGVRVMLATEESRESAIFAAKYAGISGGAKGSKKSAGVVLSSSQLSEMGDAELESRLDDIKAVVRAVSSDKRRLIHAAHEKGTKVCVTVSDMKSLNAASEADMVLAAPGCGTAVSAGADASAEKCGIKAIADTIDCSAGYAAQCRGMIIFRAVCAAAAAAMLIFLR
ncbi:MAG: hypothetical protein K2K34_02760 [Oscillospiraceae bacterium]|nr:hypothetical protein [Oscillospiraceae bacterium]